MTTEQQRLEDIREVAELIALRVANRKSLPREDWRTVAAMARQIGRRADRQVKSIDGVAA